MHRVRIEERAGPARCEVAALTQGAGPRVGIFFHRAGPFPDRILARSAASSSRVAFSSIAAVDGDLVIQHRPRSELEVAAAPGAARVVVIARPVAGDQPHRLVRARDDIGA